MGNSSAGSFEIQVRDLVNETLGGRGVPTWANPDQHKDVADLDSALKAAGVDDCNIIVGIDLTKPNVDKGRSSFHGLNLHEIGSAHGPNPYEAALSIMSEALAKYDDDGKVPMFGFGDATTKHTSVGHLSDGEVPMQGPHGLVATYKRTAPSLELSGPASFAPIIHQSIRLIRQSGGAFHVLVIFTCGVLEDECLDSTRRAIMLASSYPLSIVIIGVGDGPWDVMKDLDDGLPRREFDNVTFVPFAKFHGMITEDEGQRRLVQSAFAVCALQEVPAQFSAMRRLNMVATKSPSMEPPAKKPRVDAGPAPAPDSVVARPTSAAVTPAGRFEVHAGYISGGGDIQAEVLTVRAAMQKAASMPQCKGFTFQGTDVGLPMSIIFKDKWDNFAGPWTSYRKLDGSAQLAGSSSELIGEWYSDDFYKDQERVLVEADAATGGVRAVKITGDAAIPAGCWTWRTCVPIHVGGPPVHSMVHVRYDTTDPNGFVEVPINVTALTATKMIVNHGIFHRV